MTSGQGENQPGGPYGPPPQGWNAPPPPGPQYPGYAPAPSAPPATARRRAPQAMERPLTVRAGLGAFIGSMVLSAVAQVVTLLNWQTIIDWTLRQRRARHRRRRRRSPARRAELGAQIGIGIGFVFIAVYGLFVWFAWQGRNWARIVLWVLGGLGIVVRAGRPASSARRCRSSARWAASRCCC